MAHRAATRNTGLSSPNSAPVNSIQKPSVGFQRWCRLALSAKWPRVTQPCCAFQTSTGTVHSSMVNSASQGPGAEMDPGGGPQGKENRPADDLVERAIFAQKGRPINSPTPSQRPRRHPPAPPASPTPSPTSKTSPAAGQSSGGSCPRQAAGWPATQHQPEARPAIRQPRHPTQQQQPERRSNYGEKNRTPNSVSPQIVVLSHCAQAIIGGLL